MEDRVGINSVLHKVKLILNSSGFIEVVEIVLFQLVVN